MKRLFNLLAAVLITASAFAQAPEKVSYQAVIRDAAGALVMNKDINMTVSIVDGDSGNPIYVETHSTKTNSNGLVSLEIGSGECLDCGHGYGFDMIDWGKLDSCSIETKTTIGTLVIESSGALLSVPYALHAKTAETVNGFEVLTDVPEGAVFTDDQNAAEVSVIKIPDLKATSVQEALEEIQSSVDGIGDMKKVVYDSNDDGIVDNAATVNGLTVLTSVPANADFTDDQKATEISLTTPITIGSNQATTVEEAITKLHEQLKLLRDQMN